MTPYIPNNKVSPNCYRWKQCMQIYEVVKVVVAVVEVVEVVVEVVEVVVEVVEEVVVVVVVVVGTETIRIDDDIYECIE